MTSDFEGKMSLIYKKSNERKAPKLRNTVPHKKNKQMNENS